MTQDQLDRLIADATGEDLSEIRRLGFSVDDPELDVPAPDADPVVLDWDEAALDRNVATFPMPAHERRRAA